MSYAAKLQADKHFAADWAVKNDKPIEAADSVPGAKSGTCFKWRE